jgi:hypothetical protein
MDTHPVLTITSNSGYRNFEVEEKTYYGISLMEYSSEEDTQKPSGQLRSALRG